MSNSSLNKPTATDDAPAIVLRGNRFKPLSWETMSVEQQHMTRAVLGGQRGNMQGPYNVLLRSPEVGQLAQAFGAHTRFNCSLPLALNELAIGLRNLYGGRTAELLKRQGSQLPWFKPSQIKRQYPKVCQMMSWPCLNFVQS